MLCRYRDSCPQAKWSIAMHGDANLSPWNQVKRDSSTLTRTLYSKQAFSPTHTCTHTNTLVDMHCSAFPMSAQWEAWETKMSLFRDLISTCISQSFVCTGNPAGKSSLAISGLSLLVTWDNLEWYRVQNKSGRPVRESLRHQIAMNERLSLILLHCVILKSKEESETTLYLWPLRLGFLLHWGFQLNSRSGVWKSQLSTHAAALPNAHEPPGADNSGDLKHI